METAISTDGKRPVQGVVICGFGLAWLGLCQEPATETGRCEKHSNISCSSCGAPATRECDETMGLVCGAPLCDDCEHTICENGCNSGASRPAGLGMHCRKSDQKHLPWYMQEETASR